MRKVHQIDNDRIAITLEEAARLLGLHRETVRRLVLTGTIPAVLTNRKGSGKYLLRRSDLEEWLDRGAKEQASRRATGEQNRKAVA